MKTFTITDTQTSETFTFYSSNKQNGAVIGSIEGLEYPTVRTVIEDLAGKKSAVYVNSKFGRRIVSLAGYLFGDNTTSCELRRRNLLDTIRQDEGLKLITATTFDNINIQFEAAVVRFINPYTKNSKPLLIQFEAPDWRLYSQTEHTEEVTAGNQVVVNNAGGERTDPVLNIIGPAESVEVSNLTTGESFTISEAITAGQTLIIDTKEMTAYISTTNKFSVFSGDFLRLEPGNNTIEFTATNTTGATKLQIVYRDAYLGV